jgi:FKBP-type peptidyl-prolyl cis-trans isomerase 2
MRSNVVRACGHASLAALLITVPAAAGCAEDRATHETSQEATKERAKVVTDGSQVSIEYTLKLDDGTEVDSNVGKEPLVYTQGGGQMLPGLEKALVDLGVDDTKHVKLTAADGYGEVDPEAFRDVGVEQVPEEARKVGALLVAGGPGGGSQPIRVHEVHDDKIVLDFNHPLAGQALNFDVKIVGVE